MKLEQALDEISSLKEDEVIFARKPWDMNSDALIGQLDSNFRVPDEIADSVWRDAACHVFSRFGR
jgi:hypothetical protein